MAGLEFRTRSWIALCGTCLLVSVVLLISGWGGLLASIAGRDLAEPVEIEVSGVPSGHADLITFWFTQADGKHLEIRKYKSPLVWRTDGWLPETRLSAARSVLEEVTELRVRVGTKTRTFSQAQFERWRRVS